MIPRTSHFSNPFFVPATSISFHSPTMGLFSPLPLLAPPNGCPKKTGETPAVALTGGFTGNRAGHFGKSDPHFAGFAPWCMKPWKSTTFKTPGKKNRVHDIHIPPKKCKGKKGHGIELLVPRRVRKIIEQQKGYGATTPIGFNQRG